MRFILLLFLAFSAQAQPTQYQPGFWASPDYTLTGNSSRFHIGIIDATGKFYGGIKSPGRGYLKAGVAGAARVDMAGVGGTAVGGYFIGEGVGKAGGIQDEVVGSYNRADKNGIFWAAAIHGECMVDQPDTGGLCIGLNIELQRPNPLSGYIGVNVQPGEHARDVVGLQFQRGSAYRWAVDVDGAFIKLGQVDDVSFCMRFVGERQALEFWRGCGKPDATRHGWVNMNWGTPDVQLNR